MEVEADEDEHEENTRRADWLFQLTGKISKSWKRRWVVLADNTLSIAKTETAKPSRFIDVCFSSAKVPQRREKKDKREYIFHVITRDSTYQFAAASGPVMLEWITAIQNAQARLMAVRLQYSLKTTPPRRATAPPAVVVGGALATSTSRDEQEASKLVEKHREAVLALLKVAGNKACADCGAKGTHSQHPAHSPIPYSIAFIPPIYCPQLTRARTQPLFPLHLSTATHLTSRRPH